MWTISAMENVIWEEDSLVWERVNERGYKIPEPGAKESSNWLRAAEANIESTTRLQW